MLCGLTRIFERSSFKLILKSNVLACSLSLSLFCLHSLFHKSNSRKIHYVLEWLSQRHRSHNARPNSKLYGCKRETQPQYFFGTSRSNSQFSCPKPLTCTLAVTPLSHESRRVHLRSDGAVPGLQGCGLQICSPLLGQPGQPLACTSLLGSLDTGAMSVVSKTSLSFFPH